MKRLATLVASLICLTALGQCEILTFNSPTNYAPSAFALSHGTNTGQYYEETSYIPVINPTNNVGTIAWWKPLSFPTGNNYFVLRAFCFTNGTLLMSKWGNEIVVSNAAVFSLTIQQSSNLATWTDWATNICIAPDAPPNNFRLKLARTNLLSQ